MFNVRKTYKAYIDFGIFSLYLIFVKQRQLNFLFYEQLGEFFHVGWQNNNNNANFQGQHA